MKKYSTFIFESFNFDIDNKKLYLNYSFDGELFFQEIIEFPSDKILSCTDLLALNNVFKYLHIAAGISYYKLFIPFNIEIKTFDLNKNQAEFFNKFYINGLGEFACRNNIVDIKERINFPYKNEVNNYYYEYKLQNKFAIPIGGGKDSITTLEIIKKYCTNDEIIACSIGIAKPIKETIKVSGCKSFHPIRTISRNLLELNKNLYEIGGYNGHVPISGILSFILCASSIIYDYDTILMSNERSANIGNTKFSDYIVNHQWSKSFDFEKDINNFFKKYILEDFNYISFLRPISELQIAKIFSKLVEYHKVFTSCNKNFKIEKNLDGHWCCNCDKCRFIFLILSVFLTKNKLVDIFGKDLLNDETQLDGYLELCGLKNYKPFECVGEIEESIYSILSVDETFKNDFIVKKLQEKLKNYSTEELHKKYFTISEKDNLLSDKFLKILKENI